MCPRLPLPSLSSSLDLMELLLAGVALLMLAITMTIVVSQLV
jgi:hypothetical protein